MKRDITEALEEYTTLEGKKDFYPSDIGQILETARREDGHIDTCMAIGNALEAGYMVGYREAQKHASQDA